MILASVGLLPLLDGSTLLATFSERFWSVPRPPLPASAVFVSFYKVMLPTLAFPISVKPEKPCLKSQNQPNKQKTHFQETQERELNRKAVFA